MATLFHFQDVSDVLKQKRKHKSWINHLIDSTDRKSGDINYIFCSDDYLLEINQKHLNHKTLTDIITFDMSEDDTELSADIFISTERVRENSKALNVKFELELRRVMIHGVLHLLGFSDKTETQKQTMRKAEDRALSQYSSE